MNENPNNKLKGYSVQLFAIYWNLSSFLVHYNKNSSLVFRHWNWKKMKVHDLFE